MKYLKTLFLFLLTALAPTAWAQVRSCKVDVSTIQKGFSYSGNEYQGLVYEDDSSLLGNEEMHIVVVEQVKSSNSFKTPENLFKVDALGNILSTETLESIGTIKASSSFRANSVDTTFGSENKTAPTELLEASACNHVSVAFSSSDPFTVFHVYVFFLDSRFAINHTEEQTGIFAIDATTTRVNKWSVVYGGSLTAMSNGGRFKVIFTDSSLEGIDFSSFKTCDYIAPSIPAILPQSLVVGEEALSGTALEAYLAPAVEGLASNEDGFTLTGSSNDVLTYTLQTKSSLDEEWVNFDAVLADLLENEKKVLESSSEKCYTYLRVKKSTQIKIPRLPNETQRFYRLKAE